MVMWSRFFGKTRKIKCPDNSERIVFTDFEDVIPFYGKDVVTRTSAAITA